MPKPYDHQAFLEHMNEVMRERGLPGPWDFLHLEPGPWTPITASLARATVAIVSSGGVHCRDQEPFDVVPRGDLRFYEVPTAAEPSDLMITHPSYDHSDADRDINCVFPYERLQQFAKEGLIGALAPRAYTLMGRIPNADMIQRTLAPQIAERVRSDSVDLALLTAG